MEDDQLSKYIGKYGDRMVTRQFAQRFISATGASSTGRQSLPRLAKRVASKIYLDNCPVMEKKLKNLGNDNARKKQRRFEIGWIHFDPEAKKYKQVREKQGGGTRHLTADLSLRLEHALTIATELFFPEGFSSKGQISMFDYHLADSCGRKFNTAITIEDLYVKLKSKMLRVYLATKLKTEAGTQDEKPEELQLKEENSNLQTDTSVPNVDGTSIHQEGDNVVNRDKSLYYMDELAVEHNFEEKIFSSETENLLEDRDVQKAIENSLDDTVEFGRISTDGDINLDETLPLPSPVDQNELIVTLKLHRSHVFNEVNEAMKKGKLHEGLYGINVTMVLPNGEKEQGEDSGGVLRDALSEYWGTFYEKCTRGSNMKIPVIRHDMSDTWEVVAKVLVLGYRLTGYFPVAISKPFLEYCFRSAEDTEVDTMRVTESFLEVVPEHERKLLEQSRNTKSLSKILQSDEFLDLLDAHEVKSLVTTENWEEILGQIAHKEIIQEPAYIAERWRPVFLRSLKPVLPKGGIDQICLNLNPCARKIIACLDFGQEDLSARDKFCAELLKKFLRQASKEIMKRFLRFCTGSNILVCDKIHVRFTTPESDFSRRPIGHTCGCTLEVPNTYTSLIEMCEEFNQLLESNVWVMDII